MLYIIQQYYTHTYTSVEAALKTNLTNNIVLELMFASRQYINIAVSKLIPLTMFSHFLVLHCNL